MTLKPWHKIHSAFKLQGLQYSLKSLENQAKELSISKKEHERHLGQFLSEWLNDQPNVMVKTSGSTGSPKTIYITKQAMIHSAMATHQHFKLKVGAEALLCLSTQFIAGKMMVVRALVNGWHLHVVPPTATPLAKNLNKYDFVAMVPLQLQNSLKDLGLVKTLIVGGAPISAEIKEKLFEVSTAIYETYGMTETITHIAVKQINVSPPVSRAGSIAIDNYVSSSADENNFKILPNIFISKDERGCLVINAPKILDSQVVTNDLAEIVSPTEFKWLGRFDNIINSGGVKLVPEQIEAKLAPFISQRFFVAGKPDKILGQKLILVIEGNDRSTDIIKRISQESGLSKYQVPKEILFLEKFIETDNGKVNRMKTMQNIF